MAAVGNLGNLTHGCLPNAFCECVWGRPKLLSLIRAWHSFTQTLIYDKVDRVWVKLCGEPPLAHPPSACTNGGENARRKHMCGPAVWTHPSTHHCKHIVCCCATGYRAIVKVRYILGQPRVPVN